MIFFIASCKRFSPSALLTLPYLAASSMIRAQDVQQAAADHSKTNQVERDPSAVTADRQETNSADREPTGKIRSAITGQENVSRFSRR